MLSMKIDNKNKNYLSQLYIDFIILSWILTQCKVGWSRRIFPILNLDFIGLLCLGCLHRVTSVVIINYCYINNLNTMHNDK